MKKKNPNELLTLSEWDKERFPHSPHHPNTLRKWAKNGNIYPNPMKIGKAFRVKRKAQYYDLKTGEMA